MKLSKMIFGLAVVAVAGVNAWLANDVNARNNVLSMLNLENIAEANECIPGTIESGKTEDGRSWTGCCEYDPNTICGTRQAAEGFSGLIYISGHSKVWFN